MPTNPYITLMTAARTHAFAHGVKVAPVLSPEDKVLLGDHPELDVAELRRAGFRVIPWNPNDPEVIRTLIRRRKPVPRLMIAARPVTPRASNQIGRASCRERVC